MGAHMRDVFVLWTLLLFFSSKSSGLKCSNKCGSALEDCSCQATRVSSTNCCPRYNQSCFQVSPFSSSMLGGKALRILGLSLSPNDSLHCRFTGEAEPGIIDEEGLPYCISPLLYETGWISFDVSTDGINFNRPGEYLSVRPSKEDPSFEVTLVNSTLWQNYGTPNMEGWLTMTWNSSLVESETIDVELWGYREVNRTTWPSPKGEISYLYSLGKNISNTGVVFGCLHFVTFDGLSYTFSGKGEYHLVLSEDRQLRVQTRTEQLKLENGTFVKATQLSSVAMKEKSSDVIEVRTADGHLQVLRNQKILSFTEQTLMNLQGVFVFAPSPQSVTVIFSSGAAVELRLQSGTMSATVLLPPEFSNHTLGLLCRMNAYPSDDLMTQSGGVMSLVNATTEEIFPFGARWNISKMSSLFTYDSHYLLDSYFFPSSHDPSFVPAFSLPMKSDDPLVADMLSMCLGEGEQFCKHDTLISRSLAVGNATLKAHQHHRALMEALKPVVSCGWLPTPRNGKKNGTDYLQGKTLGFTCNEGYILYRSTERTCLEDGLWTGEKPYCITDDTVSFIVGAVGSVSALITMVIAIKLHNRKVREKKEPMEMVTQVHT